MSNTTLQNITSLAGGQPNSTRVGLFPLPAEAKYLLYIVNVVVFILGTSGNGFIIYWLGFRQKHLRGGDAFIVALAGTDLFAAITTPVYLVNQLRNNAMWTFGAFACKVAIGMVLVPVMASAWILVVIAVERRRAIRYPLKPQWTAKVAKSTTILVYLLSISVVSPRIYYQTVDDRSVCVDVYDTPVMFPIVRLIFHACSLVIPLTSLACLYSSIMYRLAQITRSQDFSRSVKKERKATMMCAIVVTLFFIMTTPHTIASTLMAVIYTFYRSSFDPNVLNILNAITPTILVANNCANPFVYAKMHSKIRPQILRIWRTNVRAQGRSKAYSITSSNVYRASFHSSNST